MLPPRLIGRGASSVASAVLDAGLTTFVTQTPVRLDQDPLFRKADVVSFTPVGRGRALPYADRETVRSQDIPHEPHLHGTLGAVGRVREHQLPQLTPRMPRARCQPRKHRLLSGETALERPTEDREHVVNRPERAHIEQGLLYRGSPRPMQRINGGIGLRSSMQHDPTGRPDPVSRVDDKVDVLRRDRVEAVNERGGRVRPGRAVDRQLRGDGAGAPIVPTPHRQVDAMVDGDPVASAQPPADRWGRSYRRPGIAPG